MAQVFATPGSSAADGIVYPDLSGKYFPVIDAPVVDGLGITSPWGAGSMAVITGEGGGGSVVGNTPTPGLLTGITAQSLSYNVEGLVGPQGPQGPKGDPGSITTIKQQVFVPYGDNLDVTLQQIRDTWENEDAILYAESAELRWLRPWSPLDVEAGTSSWNDADIDADGSFMVIAADDGIYISTDSGDNWTKKTPDTEDFVQAAVSASTEYAVVRGEDSSAEGKIWTSDDSGANWTQVTLEL